MPRRKSNESRARVTDVEPTRNRNRPRFSTPTTDTFRKAIATVIVVVWAILYLRTIISDEFTAPPELSAIMLAVVAWLFRVRNGNGKS